MQGHSSGKHLPWDFWGVTELNLLLLCCESTAGNAPSQDALARMGSAPVLPIDPNLSDPVFYPGCVSNPPERAELSKDRMCKAACCQPGMCVGTVAH